MRQKRAARGGCNRFDTKTRARADMADIPNNFLPALRKPGANTRRRKL